MRKLPIILGITAVVLIILGGAFMLHRQRSMADGVTPLVNQATLKTLPVKDASLANVSHLASSIIPPTNSWLSGMVLQKTPLAVYPMPLSFLAKETGFEIGLPTVTSNPTTITGGHTAGIAASIDQATNFKMTRYDKVSCTLAYKDARDTDLGSLTLAEGVPYVYYHALTDGTITLNDIVPTKSENNSSQYLRYTKGNHDYVAVVGKDTTITTSGATATIKLNKDSLVTFYALPDNKKDELRQNAGNEITSVTTLHALTKQTATTTLKYHTATDKPTVYAAMGYQQVVNPGQAVATYQNIYGNMRAMAGNELTTSAPIAPITSQLDISKLTPEHKDRLLSTLKADADKTKISAQDSYYTGKQLARAANLFDLAVQLHQTDVANQLSVVIKTAMNDRLDGKYFYFDSKIRGVAATTNAFGSEDFNDHHFHYGYFIYAASILGRHDKQFLADNKDKINLLVADIASYDDKSSDFPVQRNYDAYAGHSWAAGLAPFADGNNQESSSEAMNAWNAVALWGQLIKNDQLTETGQWMLGNESATAQHIWRASPNDIPNTPQFISPITSLNFGGKRTYSTFFSDEPNAKLGIQLIPMNPFMTDLARDAKNITKLVDASITNNNFNIALGDYTLMYLSLQDPQRALSLENNQLDSFIDDGNSRTYFNAFIFSQADK